MTALGLAVVWTFVALGAALIAVGIRGDRARGRRRCPRCWYELGDTGSRRCSECGREARRERELHRSRRRWWIVALGVILLLAAYALRVGSEVRARGLIAALPGPALVELLEVRRAGFANGIVPPGATALERLREAVLGEFSRRAWQGAANGAPTSFMDPWSRWRLGGRALATDGPMVVRVRPTWPPSVPVSIWIQPSLGLRRSEFSPIDTRLEVTLSGRGRAGERERGEIFTFPSTARIVSLDVRGLEGPFTLKSDRIALVPHRLPTLRVQRESRRLEITITPEAIAAASPLFDARFADAVRVTADSEALVIDLGELDLEDTLVAGEAELLRDGVLVARVDGGFAFDGRSLWWRWCDQQAILAGASPEVGMPETHEWTNSEGQLMVSSLRGRWTVRLVGDLEKALIAELKVGPRNGRWATQWWSGSQIFPVGDGHRLRPPG